MNISIYKNAKDNFSQETTSVADFLNGIKFGTWREQIEEIRAEPDKKKRTALKELLPCITASGTFTSRKESALTSHSGFICIDIDGYSDKTLLLSDPHTYALFKSASGNGLAVLVRVSGSKHKDSFRWLQSYYFNTYGVVIDPAPSNPASLRYVSHDSEIFINEKSKVARTLIEGKQPKTLSIVISNDKIGNYVQAIVSRSISIASTYNEYLNLSFALVSGFGENGRAYFHSLCSVDAKYDSRHADRQYDIAIKRGKTGVTVGTFYYLLKQAGIQLEPDHKSTALVAMAKKHGRDKESVKKQLVEINGISPENANQFVNEGYERSDVDIKSVTRDPENLIEALIEFMNQNHALRRNLLTGSVEEGAIELKRDRLNTIYLRSRMFFNTKDVNRDLIESIIWSENTPSYNPITEYIEKNSWRKSTGNVQAIMATINSDTPGGGKFLLRWLLGIIAVYKGEPVPYVLSLVGPGGTGKTEWFRRLLPAALQIYYGESRLDAGKDDELLMCQKLILMDDEMGGKSKQDAKRMNNLTSKSIFSLRAPYGRQNENFKRLALLCGTSNETDIITDRTGNRRILVLEVNSINHEEYNEIDKDELFMELYRLYEAGETWKMNEEERGQLTLTSKQFETINQEAEILQSLFYPATEGGAGLPVEMMATEIKGYIEAQTTHRIMSLKYFGIELKKYFGPGTRTKKGHFYSVIKKQTHTL